MKKIILLIIFQIAVVAVAQDKRGAEVLVSEGIYLHDRGNYTGALAKYDKALELDANNFNAMAEKTVTYSAMGRFQDAVDLCSKIVELHSEDEDLTIIYITWGNSLDGLKKPESALEVYEEGIARYPDKYLLYFNAGITYAGLSEWDKSLEYFNKSAMLNPEHAGSHNAISRVLYTDNKIPAIMAVLRFLVIEPKGSRAEKNLELLQDLLYGNVQKTGKNEISISFDGSFFKDSSEVKPNDFSSVDLIFTMSTAMTLSSENKKTNDAERLNSLITTLASSLEENKSKNTGFYWDYYAPYFIEMDNKGLTRPFCYIVYSAGNEKYAKKWQQKNASMILKFYKWSDNYTWFKG